MRIATLSRIGWTAALVTVSAMVVGRLLTGDAAIVVAGVQAVASGVVLWAGLASRRWVGVLVGVVLLAGVLAGSQVSVWAAREAPAGLAHAMLYGAILVVFGRSLTPGREAVVTQIARRVNGRFRAGMVPYTRAVTMAWCVLAAGQLAASALLLAAGWWQTWALLVGGAHGVLAAMLAAGEFAVRRWRFPGEHTGFWDTIRGVRQRGSGT